MKESGINYIIERLGLDSGSFGVFYTFEDGAGTKISSISGGQSDYSGVLSSISSFWSKPGSGLFSGNTISISNASGLYSPAWTKIFVYEKLNTDELVLFDSLNGPTGCRIGITPTNKAYFETFNLEPILATSSNNLSSKNALSFSYMTNFINIGYYNFNSKQIEFESFDYPFQLNQSDDWKLGGGTGFVDYFLYFNSYQSPDILSQLFSGLFVRPTGIGYITDTVYTSGLSGYQNVFWGNTGITGYLLTPGGDEGRDFYTGAFPTLLTQTVLTGYLNSGYISAPIYSQIEIIITGEQIDLLETLSGYASSFGMEKIQLLSTVESSDIMKISVDRTLFNNTYNKNGLRNYSAYLISPDYQNTEMSLFYNGLAQWHSGWSTSGSYLYIDGSEASDSAFFDIKDGSYAIFNVTGGLTGFGMAYTGQEVFLNGLNLISGYDFIVQGQNINLMNRNTGINGYLFEYPAILTSQTGNFSIKQIPSFCRDTSNLYFNGLRQKNKADYIEGANIDLLSGNSYNKNRIHNIYNDDDEYWE